MGKKMHTETNPDSVPASLSPESLDRLAELIFSKLMTKGIWGLPSKQVVAGSSPVSRSN